MKKIFIENIIFLIIIGGTIAGLKIHQMKTCFCDSCVTRNYEADPNNPIDYTLPNIDKED